MRGLCSVLMNFGLDSQAPPDLRSVSGTRAHALSGLGACGGAQRGRVSEAQRPLGPAHPVMRSQLSCTENALRLAGGWAWARRPLAAQNRSSRWTGLSALWVHTALASVQLHTHTPGLLSLRTYTCTRPYTPMGTQPLLFSNTYTHCAHTRPPMCALLYVHTHTLNPFSVCTPMNASLAPGYARAHTHTCTLAPDLLCIHTHLHTLPLFLMCPHVYTHSYPPFPGCTHTRVHAQVHTSSASVPLPRCLYTHVHP